MNPYLNSVLDFSEEITDVTAIGETLVYTWFGRPNWAYSESAQKYWIGSTKDTPSGTTQHITEYNISENIFTTTQVGSVYQKDDHNQSQIIIRQSDSRLIAFYTEHNGLSLRWRISSNPLDSTNWGPEKTLNPYSQYSYLSPYQDSNGNIFIFFRTTPTSAKWYFMKSTDGGETFGAATLFFDNGSVQAYLISAQTGDQVHFTATNGHPSVNSNLNVSVFHFYLDMSNETFFKSDDSSLALPLSTNDITLVSETSGNNTSWILDISFKNGNPRILYAYYPSGRTTNFETKELWFVEWNGSLWVNNQKIAQTLVGYIEDDGTLDEPAYTGSSRFNVVNPDIILMPKEVNGVLEIFKVDLSVNPIYYEQLTFDSPVDNFRPISVPSSKNNLLWLKKNSYKDYDDYSIALQAKTLVI